MLWKGGGALVLGIVIGWVAAPGNSNAEGATYGPTGLPRNCRAIVQKNVDGLRAGQWSIEEVLASLERNCGLHGHAWTE
jgi:hypothetical protein